MHHVRSSWQRSWARVRSRTYGPCDDKALRVLLPCMVMQAVVSEWYLLSRLPLELTSTHPSTESRMQRAWQQLPAACRTYTEAGAPKDGTHCVYDVCMTGQCLQPLHTTVHVDRCSMLCVDTGAHLLPAGRSRIRSVCLALPCCWVRIRTAGSRAPPWPTPEGHGFCVSDVANVLLMLFRLAPRCAVTSYCALMLTPGRLWHVRPRREHPSGGRAVLRRMERPG